MSFSASELQGYLSDTNTVGGTVEIVTQTLLLDQNKLNSDIDKLYASANAYNEEFNSRYQLNGGTYTQTITSTTQDLLLYLFYFVYLFLGILLSLYVYKNTLEPQNGLYVFVGSLLFLAVITGVIYKFA
jgi:hypothetical protein